MMIYQQDPGSYIKRKNTQSELSPSWGPWVISFRRRRPKQRLDPASGSLELLNRATWKMACPGCGPPTKKYSAKLRIFAEGLAKPNPPPDTQISRPFWSRPPSWSEPGGYPGPHADAGHPAGVGIPPAPAQAGPAPATRSFGAALASRENFQEFFGLRCQHGDEEWVRPRRGRQRNFENRWEEKVYRN